jgi:hypothetical protein
VLLALFNFCLSELIEPLTRLQAAAGRLDFPLSTSVGNAIAGPLAAVLRRFIQLGNTARSSYGLGLPIRRFDQFGEKPWCLSQDDVYRDDKTVPGGGGKEAVKWFKDELALAMPDMLHAQRAIAAEAVSQIDAGIKASAGKHQPHIGLLLAFLRLFEHFRGD